MRKKSPPLGRRHVMKLCNSPCYLSIQYGESLFLEMLWSRFHAECHKLFATHEDTRVAALAGDKT